MSDAHTPSPWGEPAAPAWAKEEAAVSWPAPAGASEREIAGRRHRGAGDATQVAVPAGSPAGPTPGAAFRFEPEAAAHLRRHRPESVGWRVFRKVRSSVGLVTIALGMGLFLAASIGGIIWAIAAAIHSAASQ